jgi:glycoprotein endo-alpha-1,2-mannosidase
MFPIIFFISLFNCKNLIQLPKNNLNYNLHTFYYAWYGNEETDGLQRHWDHEVLPHWSDKTWDNHPRFLGHEDIGANFYPELGCYSSNDTNIVSKHMQMIERAGIGVVTLSWWGKNSFEDKNVKLIMDIAESKNIKVNFHLEPIKNRSSEMVVKMIDYIIKKYGEHNAFYRFEGKPLFYVYDSYHISKDDWASILKPGTLNTIRDTKLDSHIIGLWVHEEESDFFIDGGFDGVYTYFASNGFTFGASTKNWKFLSNWAKKNDKIFIPCVGPGYSDTRIRPWNAQNYKNRNSGKYYDAMFDAAIKSQPDFIGIASFNEWHEGTQIEPAKPKNMNSYNYEDYSPLKNDYFLLRTKEWSSMFNE